MVLPSSVSPTSSTIQLESGQRKSDVLDVVLENWKRERAQAKHTIVITLFVDLARGEAAVDDQH